jgi:glucosamine-6-phosphate deaminase
MRVIIREDANTVADYVANYVKDRINAFVPSEATPYFVLGLPTGSTPIGVYKRLVDYHKVRVMYQRH